ncbi:hypothetical protein ALC53_06384 [Atta colombica]|uniref:Uncharacterized protein n=1 Tax=Atta colombica TaxID=520822 RepID=A0A195BEW5_9HYME|nr:hypothetical protein ALC53_06384 [Atta colombica]
MGGGTVVGRPWLICKWKGTEIEFYVRIELAIFFSQIAARREEVVAADEREISRSTNGGTRSYGADGIQSAMDVPYNSRSRSLICHETFNSSPSPPSPTNFVPLNSRCLLTPPVVQSREIAYDPNEHFPTAYDALFRIAPGGATMVAAMPFQARRNRD